MAKRDLGSHTCGRAQILVLAEVPDDAAYALENLLLTNRLCVCAPPRPDTPCSPKKRSRQQLRPMLTSFQDERNHCDEGAKAAALPPPPILVLARAHSSSSNTSVHDMSEANIPRMLVLCAPLRSPATSLMSILSRSRSRRQNAQRANALPSAMAVSPLAWTSNAPGTAINLIRKRRGTKEPPCMRMHAKSGQRGDTHTHTHARALGLGGRSHHQPSCPAGWQLGATKAAQRTLKQ